MYILENQWIMCRVTELLPLLAVDIFGSILSHWSWPVLSSNLPRPLSWTCLLKKHQVVFSLLNLVLDLKTNKNRKKKKLTKMNIQQNRIEFFSFFKNQNDHFQASWFQWCMAKCSNFWKPWMQGAVKWNAVVSTDESRGSTLSAHQ